MKYTLIFIYFFCNMAIAQTPIAYYSFDNNTNDLSGNNNNGIVRGDVIPVRDRFNKPCSAMHFDGISSFIEVPNSVSLESINKIFTFTTWYKFDNYSNNQWLSVFCKGKTAKETKTNPQYRFQIQQSPYSISTSCGTGIPTQNGFSTISFNNDFTKCDFSFKDHPFEINQWCFYALTYDGTTVSAFMNGNKVYSFNYSGTINANKESLYIGTDEPGSTEFFEGSLDDLRIFDTNLSDNEILNLYNENRPINDINELPFQSNISCNLALNECKKKVDYSFPNIYDNCNSIKVRLIEGKPSGSLFPVGTHKISYEIADNGGTLQRNTFSINVVDLIPPTFVYKPSDTTLYFEEPQTNVSYYYKEPIATDNCEIKSNIKLSGSASGGGLSEGLHEIIYEATDKSNNTAKTSFKVKVEKKVSKIIQPPVAKTIINDTVKVIDKRTIYDTIKTKQTVRDTIKVYDKRIIYDTVKIIDKKTVTDTIKIKTKQIIRDTVKVYDRKTFYDTIKLKVYDTIRPVLKSIEPKLQKRDSLAGRKNTLQNVINISAKKIIVSVYDDAIVDGDTVSVFYNGEIKVDRKLITDRALDFEIELEDGQDNTLIMYAHNLGSISPNTGMLIFYDGKKRYEVYFRSDIETNAKIVLRHSNLPNKNE